MSDTEFHTEDSNGYKTPFFYAVTIIVTIAIALSGWSLALGVEHSNKIAMIEGSQFTRTDASELKADIFKEMREGFSEVKRCIRGSHECD